jgi:hypothetical protein
MVFFYPNLLGHSDNYIPADPMVTPASIVPEWYLLPFYAILRSIPNKLLGVIAMFGSLLILLILPLTDLSIIRGNQFRPAMKLAFWFFVVDFIILMWIGSQHPTTPFVEIGQVATAFYFSWFIIIVPIIGLLENTLFTIALDSNLTKNGNGNGISPFASRYYNLKIFVRNCYWGVKLGLAIPIVPSHITKQNQQTKIKIFKLIGFFIAIIILINKVFNLNLNDFVLLFLYLIFFIFVFYNLVFNLYSIKHWYGYILNGNFIIRNPEKKFIVEASIFKFLVSFLRILFVLTVNFQMNYITILEIYLLYCKIFL